MEGQDTAKKPAMYRRGAFLCSFGLACLFLSIFVTFSQAYDSKIALALGTYDSTDKPLKTVIVPDYYPYTFVNDQGMPDGFSVDLAKAVARVMDRTLDIGVGTWEQARQALENGTVDFLPMMAASSQRGQVFDFSVPHTIAYDALFVRSNEPRISSLEDLAGKTVIVMNKDAAHDFLLGLPTAAGTIKLIPVDSLPDGLRLLASGTGNAAIMPKLVGLLLVRSLGIKNVEESPLTIQSYKRPFSFAVKKGDKALLEALSQGLSLVEANGQYRDIYDKWFGVVAPQGVPWKSILKYAAVILLASALVLMGLLAWTLSLRKRVRERTRSLESEIEARKKTEVALRESEERRRLAQDAAKAGTWEWDLCTNENFWSDELWSLFGLVPHSCRPSYEAWLRTVHSEDRPAIEQVVQEAASRGNELSAEWRSLGLDGPIRWLMARGRPVCDENGKPLRYIGIVVDITERKKAEEALSRANLVWEQTFEAISDGIMVLDDQHRIVRINRAMADALGKPKPELIGELCFNLVHGAEEPPAFCPHYELLNDGQSHEAEVTEPLLEATLDVRVSPILDQDGLVRGSVHVTRDVTERRRAEKIMLSRLRLREYSQSHSLDELLQATVDEAEELTGSVIGFFVFVESDQRTLTLQTWSTRTLREMCTAQGKGLHYSLDEAGVWVDCVRLRKPVIHNNYHALPHRKGFPAGHAEVVRELVVPVFSGDSIVAVLGVGNKPVDYNEHDIEIVSRIADLAWDITERKRSEEALLASEEQYRRMVETAGEGILSIDTESRITFVNERMAEMLGYGVDEILGKSLASFMFDEDFADHNRNMALRRQGLDQTYERRFRRRDGENLWTSISAKGLKDSSGNFAGSFAMLMDITHRKYTEEALLSLNRELRAFNICNQILLRAVDEQALLQEICNVICDEAGYRLAWVGYAENDDAKTIRPVAWAGCDDGYVADAKLSWSDDTERGQGPSGTAIRTGELVCIQDFMTDPRMAPWRESALKRGYHSGIALPLKDERSTTYGVLMIYHPKPNAMTPDEIQLMETLSNDLAFGINTIRMRDEHRRAEEELRKSEERYRTVAEFTYDWEYWVSSAGSLVYVSPSCERITGFSAQELLSDPGLMERIVHPEDRKTVSEHTHVARRLDPERSYSIDFRIVRRDGQIRWISHACRPVHGEAGQPLGRRASNRDITERKQIEMALKQSEERYRHIMENSLSGTFLYQDGRSVYANERLAKMVGYTVEGLLSIAFLDVIHPDDRHMVRELVEARLSGRDVPNRHELRLLHKSGRTVWTEVLSHRIDYQGRPAILGNIADVTQGRVLEQQLREAQKMEAIGTLTGGIAHDFNNVLQVALGYSELLLADADMPVQCRDDLSKIYDSAKRGADLVQRLLTFSRRTEINPQPLDLNLRVMELRKMLERTLPKMVDIRLIQDAKLSKINADKTAIDQVIMNLAVNARDAMPEGGKLQFETADVTLDEEYATTHLDVEPGPYVLLTVTDTGSGMDRDTLEHIFEPFFTTKGVGEGTGLGLAIVHGIVKQHGGHVQCYSEVGRGTTFKLYFPALSLHEELEEASVGEMLRGGSETILLVDDDKLIRDVGSRILQRVGYTVITASTGKEALEVYRSGSEEIDLVLLDLIMPEMGGARCLEGLLSLNPSVKVVIASGYSGDAHSRQTLESAAKGFVNKPFDIRRVLQVVRNVLDGE